jgi:hypothetical protein
MLDIAWRAVGLLTSEIALADSILRLDQAGVELTLIAPTVDVHAFDVIDPGLIQISREYVYMRGADVLQEFGPGDSVWNACETIVTQRLSIWALENQAHGQPDPTNPALQQGAANPGLQPQIDEAKGAFAVEIDSAAASDRPRDPYRPLMKSAGVM